MSLIRDIVVFLCGFLIVDVSWAQIVFPDFCPTVQTEEDFDMEQFLGKWYEAEKYFMVQEIGSRCISTEYNQLGDGEYGITRTMKTPLTFRNFYDSVNGTLRIINSDEGKLEVDMPSSTMPVSHWVLGTDYNTYAVIWSCTERGFFFSIRYAWVLTRAEYPSRYVIRDAHRVLKRNKLSPSLLVRTDQHDCDRFSYY